MDYTLLNSVALGSCLASITVALLAYIFVMLFGKSCSKSDRFILGWLFWDVMIYTWQDCPLLYFSMAGSIDKSTHVLALPLQEYARADRRVLEYDVTLMSVVLARVAINGPLCLLLIYALIQMKTYRHWLQIVLCVCEIYGFWMIFCPEWLMGSPHLVTSNWLYLWVYLGFYNGMYVVVPLAMLGQSCGQMSLAFSNPGMSRDIQLHCDKRDGKTQTA